MANQEDKKRSLFPTSEILILTTHIKETIFLAPMYSSFSLYGLIMIFPLWKLLEFSELPGFPLQFPIYENQFLDPWK